MVNVTCVICKTGHDHKNFIKGTTISDTNIDRYQLIFNRELQINDKICFSQIKKYTSHKQVKGSEVKHNENDLESKLNEDSNIDTGNHTKSCQKVEDLKMRSNINQKPENYVNYNEYFKNVIVELSCFENLIKIIQSHKCELHENGCTISIILLCKTCNKQLIWHGLSKVFEKNSKSHELQINGTVALS